MHIHNSLKEEFYIMFKVSMILLGVCLADEDDGATVEDDIGKSREGSKTDDEVVQRYTSSQIMY